MAGKQPSSGTRASSESLAALGYKAGETIAAAGSTLPRLAGTYQSVLTIAPGVNDSNGGGSLHGGRVRDFKMTVNGVSNVDPLTGAFMSNIQADAIEGMEVVTTGAGAQYGRAIGGFGEFPGRIIEGRSEWNTESYAPIEENSFLSVAHNPLSTFSIDVDTASYSNVRRYLYQNTLPPKNAVRIEELINYFPYDYPPPLAGEPFSVNVEVADCPWNMEHRLARIGLKAESVSRSSRGGSNLVFLIDVSGSMAEPAKLPLVTSSLGLLVSQLDGTDRIAIVVYAGATGLALPSTSGADRSRILAALEHLQAGGSTNGGEGLSLAYKIAKENFIPGGINRVILATDGDFNVGITDRSELLETIKKDADEGIFLTTLGFGMGNYKDDMLETLADKGNGNHAYIDSPKEARKVLVEQLGGTLVTVAKDVKLQVEFNPASVGSYRLVGYENRLMPKEHFNDDTKDAGEIGSSHTVTALYELVKPDGQESTPAVDSLKYQTSASRSDAADSGELLTVKVRYKAPDGKQSRLLAYPILDSGMSLARSSGDFKFASAVALFGMILRNSRHCAGVTMDLVSRLAAEGTGRDEGGYRAEFRKMTIHAAGLVGQRSSVRGSESEPR